MGLSIRKGYLPLREEHFFSIYSFAWLIYLVFSAFLLFRFRKNDPFFSLDYRRFLIEPWKLITFLVSGISITLAGPYTSDPTWDHINGGFMSILTYLTAPWAIARFYQWIKARISTIEVLPAVGLMLLSASWSYDIYLYWRDGFYPPTWFNNLIVSSVIYLCAGLMWNLRWQTGIGGTFAFQDLSWPTNSYSTSGSSKLFLLALPFMILAAYLTVSLLIY
jgi:hypothetical protein